MYVTKVFVHQIWYVGLQTYVVTVTGVYLIVTEVGTYVTIVTVVVTQVWIDVSQNVSVVKIVITFVGDGMIGLTLHKSAVLGITAYVTVYVIFSVTMVSKQLDQTETTVVS